MKRFGLTSRGRAVLVSAAGLGCTARLLGLVELYVLAAGAAILVVAASVFVATRRLDMDVERTVDPSHVHAGGASQIGIWVHNRSSRPGPLVTLVDRLEPGPACARFLLAPLGPQKSERAHYRFPAEERGIFRLGPLTGEIMDPFGLASRSIVLAAATEITVYPRLDRVLPPARQRGGPKDAESRHADVRSQAGGDFAGLRPYQIGDDMRRVHWPSTARTGDIMIRQHEVSRQGRVVVGVDVSPAAHSEDSFETALSAATSVFSASNARGCSVRLVTSEGYDSGYGSGAAHLHRAFGHLARLETSDANLTDIGATPGTRTVADSALVLVTTTGSDSATLERLARLVPKPDAITLVVLDSPPGNGGSRTGTSDGGLPGAGRTVMVRGEESFAASWDRAQTPRMANNT